MLNSDKDYVVEQITNFVRSDKINALKAHHNMRIYDAPLIGFAAADDPYFMEFLKPGIIGPKFILPEGWLQGARTVISYFLPFTKEIRDSNRTCGMPSQEWMSARIDGEAFNNALRVFAIQLLRGMGSKAVAPGLDERFNVENRISNWSERHIAFVAGLGTFGLHRALITAKGSAGRFGSIITSLELTPTPRSYNLFFEYCPYLTKRKCGACMGRCPTAAISRDGKDNGICSDYIDEKILSIYGPRYGCAKCNINVPCEYEIPKS